MSLSTLSGVVMNWVINFEDSFELEFDDLTASVQNECFAKLKLLEKFGPKLARPHVDTLKGSKHANMKELRFAADNGVWRLAFAFDLRRQAVLLICGDKSGSSEKRFYQSLIKKADKRFDDYLRRVK